MKNQSGTVILLNTGIALLAFNLFAVAATGDFKYDSLVYLTLNPYLHISSIDGNSLYQAAFKTWGSLGKSWRPVTDISFAVNYYFHHDRFQAFHLVNLCIHILTGMVMGLFVRKTLGLAPEFSGDKKNAVWISIAATALWLTHPILTQAVNYIYQRSTLLATLFYLLSLLFYIKGRMAEKKGTGFFFFSAAAVFAVLAWGSKEISATLPFAVVLYEWIFFQGQSEKWLKQYLPKIIILMALVSTLCYGVMGDPLTERIVAGYERHGFSMGQRLFTEFRVVAFYISQLLFAHPSRLNLVHDFPLSQGLFSPVTTFLSLVLILGLLAAGFICLKKHPVFAFGILCFFGNLVLESTVIPAHIIFEHRLYLPSVFFILSLTVLAWQRIGSRRLVCGLFLFVLVLQSFWTYERNTLWGNTLEFWKDCVDKSPSYPAATAQLAGQYVAEGNLDKAIRLYRRTAELKPLPPLIAGNCYLILGSYDFKQNAFASAEQLLKKGFLAHNGNANASFQLGTFYNDLGFDEKAGVYYRRCLKKDPYHLKAAHNLNLLKRKEIRLNADIRHRLDRYRLSGEKGLYDFLSHLMNGSKDLKAMRRSAPLKFNASKERFIRQMKRDADRDTPHLNIFVYKSLLKIDGTDAAVMHALMQEYAAINEAGASAFWRQKALASGWDGRQTIMDREAG